MEYFEVSAVIADDVQKRFPANHVDFCESHAFRCHSRDLGREELVETEGIACFEGLQVFF